MLILLFPSTNLHTLNSSSEPTGDPFPNILLSKLLANQVQEGNVAVESISGRLLETQQALVSITEELNSLKQNRDLLRTGLLCVMAGAEDPATVELCAGLRDSLKEEIVKKN